MSSLDPSRILHDSLAEGARQVLQLPTLASIEKGSKDSWNGGPGSLLRGVLPVLVTPVYYILHAAHITSIDTIILSACHTTYANTGPHLVRFPLHPCLDMSSDHLSSS